MPAVAGFGKGKRDGVAVGRKHVGALMWRMGIEALYRSPDTSKRRTRHTIYAYLLVESRELCDEVLEGFPSPPGRPARS